MVNGEWNIAVQIENREGGQRQAQPEKTGKTTPHASEPALKPSLKKMIGVRQRFLKQSEELADSKARVHDLEAALNEHSIVAITDPKGRIKYVNQKFCAISGYTESELIGKDHRIINSGYHDKSFIQDLWQTISAGNVWKGELRNRAKDGSYYWVATTIVPFQNQRGEIVEFVSIRTDITQQKNTALSLKASEAKLQTLFDTMSEGLALNQCVYDAEGIMCDYRVMAVNKAFYRTADYLGSEIVGRLATELFAIPVADIRDFWRLHRHRTEAFTHEYISPLNKKIFRITTSPIVDHQFVTSFADVTEQVRLKQKLQESEAFLRNMADNLPVLVAYWLPDYTCRFANKALGKWMGRSPESFTGKHARDIVGAEAFEARLPIYQAALSGEHKVNIDSMRTADGNLRHFMTGFIPDIAEGVVRGIFAVTSDVTEVKHQSQQIEELARTVITLVERERAEISADLHDSVGQSLVLLKLELQNMLMKHLGESYAQVRDLVRPLDEVMRVVRGMSHRLSPVYLKKLGIVTALEDLCEKVSKQSGIELKVSLQALEDVFTENWSIDLYRIVQEALTNAVKHSGATRIDVTAKANENNIVLKVADNGRGRAKAATSSGLGVLLMQQRAAAFGGQVRFESQNPGYSVLVTLPAIQKT